ncbi:MAG: glutamine--fructose-6-phosphate transaminase (isomerizing) [gamma proteobacterium symbiont of Bathyaustriella thionipta]|nr:glutamine--fructose-6-phosphate transaminase (isomerizing) [gamma proteobacterium symbiont of Bathyaustriella thionipta]
MCGIVGAVSYRDISGILLEGLQRLEYRGYDSAGLVVLHEGQLTRHRAAGKVSQLRKKLDASPLPGHSGVAHTRWATHGAPTESNAHPHICRDCIAIVHNGIIENFHELKAQQQANAHFFTSETDTEVIVHALFDELEQGADLLKSVQQVIKKLRGAYALGVIGPSEEGVMIAARSGSQLVIGLGEGENFIASDVYALLPVTRRFIFLQEGDVARIRCDEVQIFAANGQPVRREPQRSALDAAQTGRQGYRHYMLKEIYEQPQVMADTLEGRLTVNGEIHLFEGGIQKQLQQIQAVHIIACGTSYHAGLVAREWIEGELGLPCRVEVASEYRYRKPVVGSNCLFVTLSQSGETADTLAALRLAKKLPYKHTLAICNVDESSLVRESELKLMTRAGPEIGVASTKAFTTQLVTLLLLTLALRKQKTISQELLHALQSLPALCGSLLHLDSSIKQLAERFSDKQHSLFLGRGEYYPVALEGALKLKEISYIHAEAYPAGELKHGPLALIDADMPVIAVAPNNELLEKLRGNLEEVRARGGQLIVFAEQGTGMQADEQLTVIHLPRVTRLIAPIVFTLPLQLLAYHVAVLKGTDVDQPRNLAKSVTVE